MKSPPAPGSEIQLMLKWLMLVRVLVVTLLLGVSILVQLSPSGTFRSLSIFPSLIATTYFLTILYVIGLVRWTNFRIQAYIQLGLDLTLETVLVYYTGGLESPFVPFFLVTAVGSSLILDRRAGLLVAAAAVSLNAAISAAHYFRWVPGPATLQLLSDKQIGYQLFLISVAVFSVAYLSGALAEKLRRTRESLEEKSSGLAQLQAFHENVVQSISSGLLTTDVHGNVTSMNRAGSEITGFSREELQGGPWWVAFGAEDLRELFSERRPLTHSLRFDRPGVRKNGSRIQLGMTASPLRDQSGGFKGGVWVFQDLTRIKELEDEMKRREWLATIGEMAAGMAHEIRNPLASISGSMQVLGRELDLEGENRRLLEIALREAERLNGIISSFLVYARPAPLNRKKINIIDLLTESLSLLKNSPEYSRGIEIESKLPRNRHWVYVDSDKIKQVFWNLAINAAQAMPDGGRLTVQCRRVSKPASEASAKNGTPWCEVSFSDHGIGMSPEVLEKIYYPFFTTKDHGSGLGLAIVHRIVDNHGGQIRVKSRVGSGSTFTVYLPISSNGDEEDREKESVQEGESAH